MKRFRFCRNLSQVSAILTLSYIYLRCDIVGQTILPVLHHFLLIWKDFLLNYAKLTSYLNSLITAIQTQNVNETLHSNVNVKVFIPDEIKIEYLAYK